MNKDDFDYHWINLLESDPDYVVDVLEITTEELLAAFPKRAEHFIHEEYGGG